MKSNKIYQFVNNVFAYRTVRKWQVVPLTDCLNFMKQSNNDLKTK